MSPRCVLFFSFGFDTRVASNGFAVLGAVENAYIATLFLTCCWLKKNNNKYTNAVFPYTASVLFIPLTTLFQN